MQDRDLNQYSPSGSSTSKHLSCSHRLCELGGANCKSAKQSCPYSVDYYTENTSSSGLLVEDILHFAAGGDDSSNGSIQAPVIIGCASFFIHCVICFLTQREKCTIIASILETQILIMLSLSLLFLNVDVA